MRTSQTTRALKRAVTALAAVGALALGGLATSAPAAAAKAVTIDKATVTSQSTAAWSSITIKAQWSAQDPAKGDTITIKLGEGLHWGTSRLDFSLTSKKDPSLVIGDCVADRGANVLTCTLNDKVEQWDSTTGDLEAYAQFTKAMIGKDRTSLNINDAAVDVIPGDQDGDGTCDKECGPVRPEPVSQSTSKSGWLAKFDGSTYTWNWVVNVTGATEYTVVDPSATYTGIQCTNNSSWVDNDPMAVTPTVVKDPSNNSLKVTVTDTKTVCRLWFASTTKKGSASNNADVNGKTYTATSEAHQMGSGSADGSLNPTTPAPAPTASAPAPTTPAPATTAPTTKPGCPKPSAPASPSASTDPSQSPSPKPGCPGKPSPKSPAPTPTDQTSSAQAPGGGAPSSDPASTKPGDETTNPGGGAGSTSAPGTSGGASTAGDPAGSNTLAASSKPASGNSGGLASTGASIAIGGIAVLALLGGGGALYLARRRRA